MKEPVYALDPGFFCRNKVARKQEWMQQLFNGQMK